MLCGKGSLFDICDPRKSIEIYAQSKMMFCDKGKEVEEWSDVGKEEV